MSVCIDWQVTGMHADGTPLNGEEIRALIALNEFDWDADDVGWEPDSEYLADFSTTSIGTYSRSEAALAAFAKEHPDVWLEFQYRYENAWNPDAMVCDYGRFRHMTGHVSFTYDDE